MGKILYNTFMYIIGTLAVWINKKERYMMNFMSETFATKDEVKVIHEDLEHVKDLQLEVNTGIKILKWMLGFIVAVIPVFYTVFSNKTTQFTNDESRENDGIKIIPADYFLESNTYKLYESNLIERL